MAVPKTKLYTIDEFEEIVTRPENADRLLELIHGEIVEKVPTQKHGVIAGNIFGFLWTYSRQNHVGYVAQEVRHRVPGDKHNDRLPDVSYYADASKPLVERGPVPYLPDLAVEVKSPDDKLPKMREKAAYYLEHGCQMVWLVYTERRMVIVLTPEGKDILSIDDELGGGKVLPGFTLKVADIFPQSS